MAIAERLIPGFPEHMRAEGRKKIRTGDTFARRVRDSRQHHHRSICRAARSGAVESLDAIANLLPHAVAVLHGVHHG